MARQIAKRAKRANKPNPREDRNLPQFITKGTIAENIEFPKNKKVELIPRNVIQEDYVDALLDNEKDIVIAVGAAGTGKTHLATLYAIYGYQEGIYDKIVITRPAVSVDEQHGFLPGGLLEKMQPWMMPILDVFKEVYSPRQVERLITDEVISICPLSFMRGRTFKNSCIILDEAQNCTVSQMKMVLTRIGENSKMIVTGDLNQHDRGFDLNGLKDFISRLKSQNSNLMEIIEFSTKDIQRHPIIEEILHLYGEL